MSIDTPQPGDLVHDRGDSDPDDAIVVNVPDVTADEWEVEGRGCTLAEDNPDYPADTTAIVVAFVNHLVEYGPSFDPSERTEIPLETLSESSMNYYAFPKPRLEVIESPAPDPFDETTDDAEQSTKSESTESTPDREPTETEANDGGTENEDIEQAEELAPPSPELLDLKDTLEENGLTVDIEESTDNETHTLTVEKLGQTYRVRPGPVIEGDGAFRSRLEMIVDE